KAQRGVRFGQLHGALFDVFVEIDIGFVNGRLSLPAITQISRGEDHTGDVRIVQLIVRNNLKRYPLPTQAPQPQRRRNAFSRGLNGFGVFRHRPFAILRMNELEYVLAQQVRYREFQDSLLLRADEPDASLGINQSDDLRYA